MHLHIENINLSDSDKIDLKRVNEQKHEQTQGSTLGHLSGAVNWSKGQEREITRHRYKVGASNPGGGKHWRT